MASAELPFTLEDLTEAEKEYRKSKGIFHEVIRAKPGNSLLPLLYRQLASKYYNFQFRSDDIVLLSYPKSGTVWTKEILWSMYHLDQLDLAQKQHIDDRLYFIDRDIYKPHVAGDGLQNTIRFPKMCPGCTAEDGVVLQLAAAHTKPNRIIQSHLPLSHHNPTLLDTCKVVYVARNPKDMCLSAYNFLSGLGFLQSNLESCVELMMNDQLMNGSQPQHIREVWHKRSHPNLFFMMYEDMKADLPAQLLKLNSFLGIGLNKDDLNKVAQHSSLESMRAREATTPILTGLQGGKSFYRGGRVGRWAENVSKDMDKKVDAWIKDNFHDIDIKFRYK